MDAKVVRALGAAAIAAAALWLHWPPAGAEFNLDDRGFVANNESIRTPAAAAAALLRSFPPAENARGLYRPVANLSHALEWPRCRGGPAFVFVASIPGPGPAGPLRQVPPPRITEIEIVRAHCQSLGVPFAVSDHHARGGEGALELARTVVAHAEKTPRPFRPLYDWKLPVVDKIRTVAQKMYGARDVRLTKDALKDLADVERLGYAELPVCIAKTQSSLSDDPKLRGRPKDFEVTVRRIQINAGAGFLVVLTGDILRMPGLPRKPSAEGIDVVDGEIVGLS